MVDFALKRGSANRFAEYGSIIGRTFLARRPPRKNGYCNLACGWNYLDDYCNADFFAFNAVRRLIGKTVRPVDWALDLRYPFNCPSGFFDGVFCEHALEHFDFATGRRLLGEIARITKTGGTCRISVPSLEKYVAFYVGEKSPAEFDRWSNRANAFHHLTQQWGHKAVYDFELLAKTMSAAGFEGVRQCDFMQGQDQRLLLDQSKRQWETLYVEGTVA